MTHTMPTEDELTRLLEQAKVARRDHRYEEAWRCLETALEGAKDAGVPAIRVQILCQRGQIQRDLGRLAEASGSYQEAAARAKQLSNGDLRAHALRHLGDVERERGAFNAAESAYADALKLYAIDQDGGLLPRANLYRSLGLLFWDLEETDLARVYFRKALEIYRGLGIDAGVGEMEARLG